MNHSKEVDFVNLMVYTSISLNLKGLNFSHDHLEQDDWEIAGSWHAVVRKLQMI